MTTEKLLELITSLPEEEKIKLLKEVGGKLSETQVQEMLYFFGDICGISYYE